MTKPPQPCHEELKKLAKKSYDQGVLDEKYRCVEICEEMLKVRSNVLIRQIKQKIIEGNPTP